MELYPSLTEEALEYIMPKKSAINLAKCRENVSLIIVENEPIFFQHFDGPLIPSLRVLHKCTNDSYPCLFIILSQFRI